MMSETTTQRSRTAPGASDEPSSFRKWLQEMIRSGGPEPEQYELLSKGFRSLETHEDALASLRSLFRPLLEAKSASLHGHVATRPYGFPGDFLIIHRIYDNRPSRSPSIERWDRFLLSLASSQAVRNRRQFLLEWLEENAPDRARVLSVASGPCREILDFFERNPTRSMHFECIDQDPHAIAFASSLAVPWRDRIRFHRGNVLRSLPSEGHDLIYSAGLFDYLRDRSASLLLRRLWNRLRPGGRLLIGNFSPANPDRAYMEIGGWSLIHRTESELIALFEHAVGSDTAKSVRVLSEPLGINLFLEAIKPADRGLSSE